MEQRWCLEILAQKGYKAFHKHLDETVGKGYFGIDKAKEFDDISQESREAWMEAVKEVLASYPLLDCGDLAK